MTDKLPPMAKGDIVLGTLFLGGAESDKMDDDGCDTPIIKE